MRLAPRVLLNQSINYRNSLHFNSATTVNPTTSRAFSIRTLSAMSSLPIQPTASSPSDKISEQNQDQKQAEEREESVEEGTPAPSKYAGTGFSVFGQGITKIHDVPMSIIRRPIPSELDEEKVNVFMKEVARGDEFTPIEVLRVRDPSDPSKSYYYSVGGCHRFEAHKRLEKETIRGKIIEVPPGVMRPYLVNPPF